MRDEEIDAAIRGARHAAYAGDGDQARRSVAALRAQVAIHDRPATSAAVIVAEGLAFAADGDGGAATDRFRRAQAVARVAGREDVADLAQAWIAQCRLDAGDAAGALDALAGSGGPGGPGGPVGLVPAGRAAGRDVELRHRLSLLAAQLWAHAGDRAAADAWADAARRTAGVTASRELFSATLLSMCALRAWQSTLGHRLDGTVPDRDAIVADLLLLSSSANYDQMAAIGGRPALRGLLRARLLAAAGRPREALLHLDATDVRDGRLSPIDRARVAVQRAACRVELGDGGPGDVVAVEAALGPLPDDDRAQAHRVLARLGAGLPGAHAEQSRQYASRCAERRRDLAADLRAIAPFEPGQLAGK